MRQSSGKHASAPDPAGTRCCVDKVGSLTRRCASDMSPAARDSAASTARMRAASAATRCRSRRCCFAINASPADTRAKPLSTASTCSLSGTSLQMSYDDVWRQIFAGFGVQGLKGCLWDVQAPPCATARRLGLSEARLCWGCCQWPVATAAATAARCRPAAGPPRQRRPGCHLRMIPSIASQMLTVLLSVVR